MNKHFEKGKPAKLLMIQGTGSSVGKSILVAGLCRYFYRQGVAVAPFKAQNMALNSFITPEGHEMGRAQVVQAEACGLPPHVDMNPVLIKPNSDVGAQVIIHGAVHGTMSALAYHQYKAKAWEAVKASFTRLQSRYELIIIEGAGSPAEINLRDNDIVNMGLATSVRAPVLLVGDIDKGGVFASLVGTMELLAPAERSLVRGFVVNKFRGDQRLLQSGLDMIAARCGVPFVGVVPFFRDIYLPEEDGVAVEGYGRTAVGADDGRLAIGVVKLPHIANFTDFDPLLHEPDVRLDYLMVDDVLEDYDLIILPGSKNTIDDLMVLQQAGLAERLRTFAARGGAIIGICGGYQMLGRRISDPHQVETTRGQVAGFGLLPVDTELAGEKVTVQSRGQLSIPLFSLPPGLPVAGYEIHMGRTTLHEATTPLLEIKKSGRLEEHYDGAITADGMIWGTYLHGIFDNDLFRSGFLQGLRKHRHGVDRPAAAGDSFAVRKEQGLDQLADLLIRSLDLAAIESIIADGVTSQPPVMK
ncbi:MAG: cobyric acid synthase [Deltaproteobacteria bacterium]|nr:cobyric acid synthase [Candidatus Anaeroferrophillus wilburensis]MBN2889475.1 cobyric acid synthase [Deltaproteobacteria bacterium]